MKVEDQFSDKECLKINKIYGCLFSSHTLHVCLVLNVCGCNKQSCHYCGVVVKFPLETSNVVDACMVGDTEAHLQHVLKRLDPVCHESNLTKEEMIKEK